MFKTYEAYKNSWIDWVGEMPAHWEVKRIKNLFEEIDETNKSDKNATLLSLFTSIGVKPRSEMENKGNRATTVMDYKFVKKNDLVVNKLLAWMGSIAFSDYEGVTSPDYDVYRQRTGATVNTKYYHNYFRSANFKGDCFKYGHGIMMMRWRTYPEEFLKILILHPPLEEQYQIARFLDSKLSKIAKLLNAKKKQITLLKEQKQAIINRAVTKGLDGGAKMKPSGVEWLGEIPAGWESYKLKNICSVNPSLPKSHSIMEDSLVTFLPMEKIYVGGEIDNSEKRVVKDVKSGFTCFAKNDVVIAKITPCFENGKGACLSTLDSEIGYGTTELIVLRCGERIIPKYLYLISQISYFRKMGEEKMTGAAGQKRVSPSFVADFRIAIPDIKQQENIINYIEQKSAGIDKTISEIMREIALIGEYRTRLISDAVTGKIDVRDVEVADVDTEQEIEEIDETEDDNEYETEDAKNPHAE